MNFRYFALAAITAIALSACGGAAKPGQTRPAVDGKSLGAEGIVARNAKARWDAIIAKDFRPAYDLLTPGTRATTPFDAYVKRLLNATIRWTGAEVEVVECDEPDVCRAVVNITYLVHGTQPGMGDIEGTTPVFEQWIQSDGQWYHLPDRTGR